MVKNKVILTILFIMIAGVCKAEPDSTIKYLMKEPVSMLEWGMFRLANEFEAETDGNIYSVTYDWDKNRIQIERHLKFLKPEQDKSGAIYKCKNEIDLIRIIATSGRYQRCFAHSGFTRGQEPVAFELAHYLMKITEIKVETVYEDDKKKRIFLICMGPLEGSDIYFTEKEWE